MRFEARHHLFKRLAQNFGNYINLSCTLAMRYRLLQCYYYQSNDYLGSETEIGPGGCIMCLHVQYIQAHKGEGWEGGCTGRYIV